MSLEVARVEIEYLKKNHEELREEIRLLTKQVSKLNQQLLELRLGRKWLWGLLSASVAVGAFVHYLVSALSALKIFS